MSLWSTRPVVVGMIHLPALPGAPRWRGSLSEILEVAERDARLLADAGVDGLMVENFGDVPFLSGPSPPEAIAALTLAAATAVEASGLPVGVNVLRNDARSALGVALSVGASFIRVNVHTGTMFTDQGPLVGAADSTLRARAALDAPVAILADVLVKHATAPAGITLENSARDCWDRGLADGLIVSGSATGRPAQPDHVARVKSAVPGAPVWLGSGVTTGSLDEDLHGADGIIVGSALRESGVAGRPVDSDRVEAFMAEVARLRTARSD